jgi:hypothetical protein
MRKEEGMNSTKKYGVDAGVQTDESLLAALLGREPDS